jgi:hypothetical protein
MSSLAWIALSMAAISRTLVEGTPRQERTLQPLGKPNAGIRGDQPDAF